MSPRRGGPRGSSPARVVADQVGDVLELAGGGELRAVDQVEAHQVGHVAGGDRLGELGDHLGVRDVGEVDLAVGVRLVPRRHQRVDHRGVAARALPHLQVAAAAAVTSVAWSPAVVGGPGGRRSPACRRSSAPARRSPRHLARRVAGAASSSSSSPPHATTDAAPSASTHSIRWTFMDPPRWNCLTVLKWYAVNAMLSSECSGPRRRGRMTAGPGEDEVADGGDEGAQPGGTATTTPAAS